MGLDKNGTHLHDITLANNVFKAQACRTKISQTMDL